MEQNQRPKREKTDHESARMGGQSARHGDPFARADPLTQADPFADLLELSFSHAPKQPSEAATVAPDKPTAAASASARLASAGFEPTTSAGEGLGWGMDPLMTNEGTLAAKKRKSQESRQKRDQFLNQMSSFLEGMESNTADVIPLEPPVSLPSAQGWATVASSTSQPSLPLAEPAGAGDVASADSRLNASQEWPSAASTSTFPDLSNNSLPSSSRAAGSSLMQEDFSEDPFYAKELPKRTIKAQGDLRRVMGASKNPHPRGSLFDDDDVDLADAGQEEDGNSMRPGNLVASDSAQSSPKRVTPSPLPFSAPPREPRGSLPQARSKSKKKPSRGLDLEEVRRRTSLLSGEARASSTPGRAPAPSRPPAPRPVDSSSYDMEWRRQQTPSSAGVSDEAPHPLHAAPVDPLFSGGTSGGTFDDRGNYFNEALLLAREQGSKDKGLVPWEEGSRSGRSRQGAWGGDALMDSAGSFLNTARDGAKTFFQDAKAGVDAVGASVGWQNDHEEKNARFDQVRQPPRTRQEESESRRNFEVTFGEGRLGFTLFREETGPRKGKGVVCKVHPGSTAQTLGVQLGDVVSGVNKRRYDTYDEVMEVLPKLSRPVLISFTRGGTDQSSRSTEGLAVAARRSSAPPDNAQGGGGNPLEWLAKLNPFDKRSREEGDELRGERRSSLKAPVDGKMSCSQEYGLPGEVFASGLRGGVFSWSYYGTSDGIEPNTRDTYTEHVMRCQWGRTAGTMQSWMVARRYREFDALDLDLRDAYPDRKDALPRLPPKEFFKMARDVVERRTKGLEMYMTTLIRRFPDMLECPHLDRFLTISERLSGMQTSTTARNNGQQALSYRNLGTHGSSSNVFPASETSMEANSTRPASSTLVGTDYILNLMSSEEAYRLSQARHSDAVDVAVAEDLIGELEDHLSSISPKAHLLSDTKLYGLVERCQKCWPRIKMAAAVAVSGESSRSYESLLPRIVQCDEGMERAFEHLKAALASRGYITDVP